MQKAKRAAQRELLPSFKKKKKCRQRILKASKVCKQCWEV